MMILSRAHARRLVRKGHATETGVTRTDDERSTGRLGHVALTRHDVQRTDHYPATLEDVQRLEITTAARALGRRGGAAGRGAAKARTPEQAAAAGRALWAGMSAEQRSAEMSRRRKKGASLSKGLDRRKR